MNTNPHVKTEATIAHTSNETAALLRVLQLDVDLRRIETERELVYYLANETRSVLGYRQAFVLRKRSDWSLEAVSSVTSFDRNAPINRQVTKFVSYLSKQPEGEKVTRVRLDEKPHLDALQSHMFLNAIWMPLKTRKGRVFAGILVLHDKEWPESVMPLVERVSEASAYTWRALKGPILDRRRWLPRRTVLLFLVLFLAALGFLRAPLTVLAPTEVSSQDSVMVTAPLDGVIEGLDVAPNQFVSAGDRLARMENTELRNALDIAESRIIVAQARLRQLQNVAFTERDAARELKVAQAEVALAKAERELAQDRLSRTEIKAGKSGIAVFDDSQDLTGRPVVMGEKIMEIVSPENIEFTVRLPVIDNVNLKEGSKVRIFLDGDPLNPIEATLNDTSYRAVTQPDGSFSYTLKARAKNKNALDDIRIGAYGTAQLYGDRHSLYFIVFRRPLSWLRQSIGI